MKTFSQFISEVTLGAGEHYGSEGYQDAVLKARQKRKDLEAAKLKADADAARADFRSGFMRGSKDGRKGKFYQGLPDRYTEFVPD